MALVGVRTRGDRCLEDAAPLGFIAVPQVPEGDEDLFPPGDLVRHTLFRAHGDDCRPRLGGDRPALCVGRRVDESAGRRVELFVTAGERRPPAGDEVELLMTVALEVLLDDPVAGLLSRVRVDAKRGDSEASAHRPPDEALSLDTDWKTIELVEVRDLVGLLRHVLLRSASRTTGSICSAPSTRSSRFSFPAHCVKASSSSTS